jgi:hypothetical protein
MRPYVKKPHHKSGLVEWLKVVGPEFKPQYHQKKKKKKEKAISPTCLSHGLGT